MVTVSERIGVRDVTVIRPPALVSISERISVGDTPVLRPSARVAISERIGVTDAARVVPPAVVSVTERVGVSDTPSFRAIDDMAPTLTLPGPIAVEAQTPTGAVVTFTVSATDNLPGRVQVSCSPASGSLFPFNGTGATTTSVTCTATDAAGNVATGSFDVVVQDTTAPQVLTPQITVAATEAAGARGNVPQAPQAHLLRQLPLLGGATRCWRPESSARVRALGGLRQPGAGPGTDCQHHAVSGRPELFLLGLPRRIGQRRHRHGHNRSEPADWRPYQRAERAGNRHRSAERAAAGDGDVPGARSAWTPRPRFRRSSFRRRRREWSSSVRRSSFTRRRWRRPRWSSACGHRSATSRSGCSLWKRVQWVDRTQASTAAGEICSRAR